MLLTAWLARNGLPLPTFQSDLSASCQAEGICQISDHLTSKPNKCHRINVHWQMLDQAKAQSTCLKALKTMAQSILAEICQVLS